MGRIVSVCPLLTMAAHVRGRTPQFHKLTFRPSFKVRVPKGMVNMC